MGAPIRVDRLVIHHHDDRETVHDGGVLYYLHKLGVDVVDPDGAYLARYNRGDVLTTTTTTTKE